MSLEPVESAAFWAGFRQIQRDAYETAARAGFHDVDEGMTVGSPHWLARVSQMVTTTIAELMEAHDVHQRGLWPLDEWHWSEEGKPEGFPVELADAVIRILDTAEALKIDLAGALHVKMLHNTTRKPMHGKLF